MIWFFCRWSCWSGKGGLNRLASQGWIAALSLHSVMLLGCVMFMRTNFCFNKPYPKCYVSWSCLLWLTNTPFLWSPCLNWDNPLFAHVSFQWDVIWSTVRTSLCTQSPWLCEVGVSKLGHGLGQSEWVEIRSFALGFLSLTEVWGKCLSTFMPCICYVVF